MWNMKVFSVRQIMDINQGFQRRLLLLGTAVLLCTQLSAVPVDINSGNPKFPFPQFQSYGPGRDNLANVNAPGVTHAEMEQRTRDAFQIMMNKASYTGTTFNGVQLISYASSPDCTEGTGYALLAAASMVDKDTFDGHVDSLS